MVGWAQRVSLALAAAEARLPTNFPGKVWDAISVGMKAEAARFLAGVERL
jgi:serine/threonine-protein kinase HipA